MREMRGKRARGRALSRGMEKTKQEKHARSDSKKYNVFQAKLYIFSLFLMIQYIYLTPEIRMRTWKSAGKDESRHHENARGKRC